MLPKPALVRRGGPSTPRKSTGEREWDEARGGLKYVSGCVCSSSAARRKPYTLNGVNDT
jgi:hypothetical protein